MDLGTVKSKLLKGEYATFDDFIAQLQLIWDNCKLYNMQGSYIYKVCEKMERYYNKELNKFKQQHGLNNAGGASGGRRRAGQEADSSAMLVTTDMKKEICARIKKLPPEQLTKFAARVQ